MRFFSFSLLIGAGALLAHVYLYRRLARRLIAKGRARSAVRAGLVVITSLLLLRQPIRNVADGLARAYDIAAFGWIAAAISLVLAVLVGDLATLVVRLARAFGRRRPIPVAASEPAPADADDAIVAAPDGPNVTRRDVARAIPWVALAGGSGLAAYGSFRAFTAPEVTEIEVPIPRLPASLEGLHVVQLTDVHVGPFIGRRFIDMLVSSANALRPDVVAITGDLVDGRPDEIGAAVAGLGALRSRFGTFFVTGNHEYYSGDLEWAGFLRRLGVRVLRNERVAIGDGGGHLDLVGVDDWSGARRRGGVGYDLAAALAGRDRDRAAVLLAHQPENFAVALASGIDLQISGHTHGGQVFPFSRLVRLRYKYDRGLFQRAGGHLYVSRGCGFWGPPSRIDSPPELVSLRLVRG